MSKSHDKLLADNAAWWSAHPDFMQRVSPYDFASLAKSVIHWHHNVESMKRYGYEDGSSTFLRLYAIDATKAWLVETKKELDNIASIPAEWSKRAALEVLVRTLQHALDDFEHSSKNAGSW